MPDEKDREALRTLRLVCVALMAGVVVLGVVVAALLLGGLEPLAPGLEGLLLPVTGGYALLSLVAAPLLESALRRVPAGADRAQAMGRFSTAVIVGMALREGAALLAVVAALLTGDLAWGLGLATVVLLAMALALPTDRKLQDSLRTTR
jgi:F0F1-type ATP synthase membrane subunit c/vacuolar-type H+-ATPase subunit K